MARAERGNLQQTAGHGDLLEDVELVLLAEVARSDSADATLNREQDQSDENEKNAGKRSKPLVERLAS